MFRTPLPFKEALDSRAVKAILPTDFRTKLLAEIPAQLRERAFFPAGAKIISNYLNIERGDA